MTEITLTELARMFDHSLLQPNLTDAEIAAGLAVARTYGVASVCVKPYAVAVASAALRGTGVNVGTVIGFPHGSTFSPCKRTEAVEAMDQGAVELDMVVNVGKVLSGEYGYVRDDIAAVIHVARPRGAKVKVIFENCFLRDEHKIELCRICGEVGADWVKTSTGYGDSGATDHDLKLMRAHSPPHVQVKAAGGVRTLERVLAVRELGVTRIGATATQSILEECKKHLAAG